MLELWDACWVVAVAPALLRMLLLVLLLEYRLMQEAEMIVDVGEMVGRRWTACRRSVPH